MVVAMDVENDKFAHLLTGFDQMFFQQRVICVVLLERPFDDITCRFMMPDIEAPTVVRFNIYRFVTRTIQIDLETRAVCDDPGVCDVNPVSGIRVLFAQSVSIVKLDELGDLGPQVVAIMDRCSDDRRDASDKCPKTVFARSV